MTHEETRNARATTRETERADRLEDQYGYTEDAPDADDIIRDAVEDWSDVRLRVVSPKDADEMGVDGLTFDLGAMGVCDTGSTVELVANGETLARFIYAPDLAINRRKSTIALRGKRERVKSDDREQTTDESLSQND